MGFHWCLGAIGEAENFGGNDMNTVGKERGVRYILLNTVLSYGCSNSEMLIVVV